MPKFEGVYRAGNGSWYFKASLGRDALTGKRIQLTKRGFATASDAARARREALEAADDGSVRSIGGGLTVDELLDLSLDGSTPTAGCRSRPGSTTGATLTRTSGRGSASGESES